MKNILLINTGGTISMNEDQETGKVIPSTQHPLMEQLKHMANLAEISVENIFNLPSPHITIEHMQQLSQYIKCCYHNFDGIVITHGTDTLEETAYYLNVTLDLKIPVVLTGAMRSSNEIGADGLANLKSALLVAMNQQTVKQGVVVVMNEEIHSAAFVTKTHTTNLATFQTPTFGPVGIISKKNVIYFQQVYPDVTFEVESIDKKVALLKAYAGMTSDIIIATLHCGYDGVVIEGMGAGNMPPATLDAIKALIEQGVPVVMVSRAFNGVTEDVYDYQGGGRQLKQMGVIYTQGLSGVKARIKLLAYLNRTNNANLTVEQAFLHQY